MSIAADEYARVGKELIEWSTRQDESSVRYLENRIYAVALGIGVVVLTEAESSKAAYRKIFGFDPKE